MNIKQPDKFLKVLHRDDNSNVIGLVACAGFEMNAWRCAKLAEHLLNWLPHFALRPSEIEKIGPHNAFKLLKEAAMRLFKEENFGQRGEIGELLLHIIGVTEYRAQAFVSRLFYKMRTNDQVTGFDSALVTYDEDSEEVELWLGEAKFYENTKDAINAALKSIKQHIDQGFLEETKILVGPKIEPGSPGYEKLQWLFDDRCPLDEIVERIVVPVLIAAESTAAKDYAKSKKNYPDLVFEEYSYISGRFHKSKISKDVRIVLIYVPLDSKGDLEKKFAEKLGAFQ